MEDNLPIAVRRTRRSSSKACLCIEAQAQAQEAPTPRQKQLFKTPSRRVRFSDAGPIAAVSSGLTPFVSRVSVGTPKSRWRQSAPGGTPSGSSRFKNAQSSPALPESGEVTFLPLRQVLDGRVQRRIRRNGLSEEMNTIHHERRRRAQKTQNEIQSLKDELRNRDLEIYELQNATVVMDTERLWDLQQQVEQLKGELERRSAGDGSGVSRSYSWTVSARNLFGDEYVRNSRGGDAYEYEDDFGESTVAQLVTGTPSRAGALFPSPPATSPTIPGSPCFTEVVNTPSSRGSVHGITQTSDTGSQAMFPDRENQLLEDELASLQLEVDRLTATLDTYKALATRLTERLPRLSKTPNTERPVEEVLESQVRELLQSMSDRSEALTKLNNQIASIGFPGSDTSAMLSSLASGFRTARLELEYLTPGEITLPLTSHGAQVLNLLQTRLRTLAQQTREDEAIIDEYHEVEQSLRKQLDTRVSVMNDLKSEISEFESRLAEKDSRILELEAGNERLRGAVDGYIRDIAELENVIQELDEEHSATKASHRIHVEANRRVLMTKENHIANLERKLDDALKKSVELQSKMKEVNTSIDQRHDVELATRDVRILGLSSEVDRVNESLRMAHETVRSLRAENGELQSQMEEESDRAMTVVDSMKEELQCVLHMGQKFLNSPNPNHSIRTSRSTSMVGTKRKEVEEEVACDTPARMARLLNSKKPRKKHDSGMAMLDGEEIDI